MQRRFYVCLLLAVCLLISTGQAQVTTATFYGIVTDPTGAAIPNARVTLTHEGTGAVTTKTTDTQGEAVFNFLQSTHWYINLRSEQGWSRRQVSTGV